MDDATCTTDDCDRPVAIIKWQLCSKHYMRARKAHELDIEPHHSDRRHTLVDGVCVLDGPDHVVTRPNGRTVCALGEGQARSLHRKGIPLDVVDERYLEQDGRCASCAALFSPKNPHCIDHDHSCCPGDKACMDCFRGLLCRRCNVAAGMLLDSPVRARELADYLEKTCILRSED